MASGSSSGISCQESAEATYTEPNFSTLRCTVCTQQFIQEATCLLMNEILAKAFQRTVLEINHEDDIDVPTFLPFCPRCRTTMIRHKAHTDQFLQTAGTRDIILKDVALTSIASTTNGSYEGDGISPSSGRSYDAFVQIRQAMEIFTKKYTAEYEATMEIEDSSWN